MNGNIYGYNNFIDYLRILFFLTSWELAATLSLNSSSSSQFGLSVGVLGDFVAVGAPYFGLEDSSVASGAVFLYSDSNWSEYVQLSPFEVAVDTYFGYNVAINEHTLAVSAFDGKGDGVVYVYTNWERQGWKYHTLLLPTVTSSSAAAGAAAAKSASYFGEALALIPLAAEPQALSSSNGSSSEINHCDVSSYNATMIAVGSPGYDSLEGAIYLFFTTSAPCPLYDSSKINSLAALLTTNSTQPYSAFGESIAIGKERNHVK